MGNTTFHILWPIFKREQRRGSHVRLKEDKLYVNGQRIHPENVVQSQQIYVPNSEFQGTSQKQIIRTKQQIEEGHSFVKQHVDPPLVQTQLPPSARLRTGQQEDS
jgi:uncharacterized protein YvpB